ncbi:Secreted beta-glucosidase [Lachnellula occidentalis]|uniref:Secreted beta-glucosidase n=1 Tax=Lachnellula occidentalis TaxID=215460 RepID=A0A8H8S5P4_9HELO|nr:Secreted beta-glucosidase [Lachnellula occidentalis]
MKFSQIALLSAASIAVAQPHNHARHHHEQRGSPVEGRDVVATVNVPGAVETIYLLNGTPISGADVQAGIASGKYILVNGQVSSIASAAPVETAAASIAPSSVAAPTSAKAGEFIEKIKSTPTTSASVSNDTPASSAPASSAATSSAVSSSAAASSSTKTASSSSPSSSSGSTSSGSWPDFESGSVPCTTFPDTYGAVALDWMNNGGWSGLQHTPNFSGVLGAVGGLIDLIATPSGCQENSFCSYACPAGYQKSQWPVDNQGSTKQSVGGLYCDSQGMLQLTNPDFKQLCIKGAGGVTIESTVGDVISVCRTDYPGTEAETVPLSVNNGDTGIDLCNPDKATYYSWEGAGTSAQYYLNPSGHGPDEACWWNVEGSGLGNYSPVNLGTGSTDGQTFLSIFGNSPTLTDFSKWTLDYDVTFIVDGTESGCKYQNKQFYGLNGEVTDHTGCVVSGETIVVKFS